MHTHVRTLAVLHIIFGALGVLVGVAVFAFLGGIAGVIGMTNPGSDAVVAVPILGTIGLAILFFALALALPGIIGGVGLLNYRPWARTLMIILSALHILNFPFGTALGVYGLWALLSPEISSLFQSPQVRTGYQA